MERAGPIRRGRHYSLARTAAWAKALRIALLLLTLPASLHCPAPDTTNSADVRAAAPAGRPVSGSASAPASNTPSNAASNVDSNAAQEEPERPAIVFLGTSLTAGYGLPESEAYPALIEDRLARAGLDYQVVNAGVSGDTSAGGLRRIEWLLRLPIAVLVIELGANDMLRGQSVEALEANLASLFERARAVHPEIRFVVAGMRAAPNLGRDYATAFDAVYPRLAERFGAALVPFLLEDVAARPELNQADGIHPTAEGHARIAERVWQTLEPVARAAVR